MTPQPGSRKRPAPGTISLPDQTLSTAAQMPYQDQMLSNEDYANLVNGVTDYIGFDTSLQPYNQLTTQTQPSFSNQLVPRTKSQQLSTRTGNSMQDFWPALDQQSLQTWPGRDNQDSAQLAVSPEDAQAKREQIPPFVRKLWKFLDGEKYASLIRWTDGGTAFIVLDEDELARTVIPEYYKHNNYASFVRQLNMYGFHKRVSLNAHSMKAAERKTKDPAVWSHRYFQQGREDLLSLIQKPQDRPSGAKRKRASEQNGQDNDSDDDTPTRPHADANGNAQARNTTKESQDLVTLPRTEVNSLREEVQRLQQQQGLISKMIGSLKQKNEEFYQQASDFQSLHDRHENSINAILTFLATFYNRSLEAGVNFNDMFGNLPAPQQPRGTVVDVGEGDFPETMNDNDTRNKARMPRFRGNQLLLENSSPAKAAVSDDRITTAPPSERNSTSPPPSRNTFPLNDMQNRVRAVKSPGLSSPEVQSPKETSNDSQDMMSLINAANASTPTDGYNLDFSSVLDHAQHAGGKRPLTPQQRSDMLNLIASQGGTSKPSANNALISPNPPQMPNMDQYFETQHRLDMLTQMQKEQDAKVQQLAGRLSPLSPTGNIPGLDDSYGFITDPTQPGDQRSTPGMSDFDIDSFINSNGGVDGTNDENYFNDLMTNGGAQDISAGAANTAYDDGEDVFGLNKADEDGLNDGTAAEPVTEIDGLNTSRDGADRTTPSTTS